MFVQAGKTGQIERATIPVAFQTSEHNFFMRFFDSGMSARELSAVT